MSEPIVFNTFIRVLEHEGFSSKIYDDATGKPPKKTWGGTLTFGHGHTSIKLEHSKVLTKLVLEDYFLELKKKLPGYLSFPDEVQKVILEMSYQLGPDGVLEFKRMLQAIREKRYRDAAVEVLWNSPNEKTLLYKQAPSRAEFYSKNLAKV